MRARGRMRNMQVMNSSMPSSAQGIVEQANSEFEALIRHADALPDHAISPDFSGSRVADVLAHLTGWHEIMLGWLEAEARGVEPSFPAEGYGWDRIEELNMSLQTTRAELSHSELREMLHDSHARARAAVLEHDDARLFDEAARPWLGGGSLGYIAHELLANHYRWGESMLGQCTL